MEIELRSMALTEASADALILPVGLGLVLDPAGSAIDERLGGELSRALNAAEFSGLPGRVLTLTTLGRLPAKWIVVAGTGSDGNRVIDDIRRAWARAARAARDAGARTVMSAPPPVDVGIEFAFRAATEGVKLGLYRYLEQRTSEREAIRSIERFTFAGSGKDAQNGIERGRNVAAGVLLARDLVNRPANLLTPESLAAVAYKIA
ncbi:MAG TPA: M17 family peptidase N-terminal domain-containing protein, partial [Thermomicrobiaceae bacterium]|nr:M17 family peptidase N-terminal domain-containing protein [Thermomicrobiaceae bacterium]